MPNKRYPKPDILRLIPRDRHAVIEASAGTGKTYTIEHLFVEILLTTDAAVENILVVTFTEKAATELRMRVRRIMQNILAESGDRAGAEAAWEIDEGLELKLKRALFSFDKAPIHTIHGFFQRVIMENAFLGGRLFDQTLVDPKQVFAEEFYKALRTAMTLQPVCRENLVAWLRENGSVDDLRDLLYRSHQKKCRIRPHLDPAAFDADLEKLARELGSAFGAEQFRAECKQAKIHGGTVKALMSRIDKMHASLGSYLSTGRGTLHVSGLSSEEIDWVLERITGLPDHDAKRGLLMRLERMLLSRDAVIVQLALPLVRELLHQRKLREGLYDFDDMIGYLRDALAGPQGEALTRNLRKRYRYALIDESQDTDEVQWEIFRRLFYESPAGNRICLIGDPKQAIYGFRGADVHTYLKAREDICRGSDPVPLEQNFRSTASLIEACNLILDRNARPPFFDGLIRYDVPVTCGRPDMKAVGADGLPAVPVRLIHVRPRGETVTSREYRNKVGTSVAGEIRRLLDGGNLRISKSGEAKPVTAQDIFILTRTEREGRDVAKYLRQQGIPFAFFKQDGLFQTREAEEIRDVLAAVEQPSDTGRRLKAWMSAFFSVPMDQLHSCRDLPATHPLVGTLMEWHQLALRRDYQDLFTAMLDESGIVRRELFLSDNERRLTNYYHIFEILLEEASLASYDITDLVLLLRSFISGARNPTRDNGNIQRLETEKDAVQILTLHKSKGLEAAVVFLYGGFTTKRDEDLFPFHEGHDRYVHVGKKPPARIMESVNRENEEESRRLLYVGMTRAMARLYLPYIDPVDLNGQMQKGPYCHLNARIHALMATGGLRPDLFSIDVALEPTGSPSVEAEAPVPGDDWSPDPRLVEDTAAERVQGFSRLREEHAGFEITSYTRIQQRQSGRSGDEDDDRTVDQSDRTAALLTAAAAGTIGGAAFGSAIHAIMERISFASLQGVGFPDWSLREVEQALFREVLGRNGIDTSYLGYAQELVHTALTTPIELAPGAVVPGLCMLTEYSRETGFLYPYPESCNPGLGSSGGEHRIERGYVTGFIDLLFRSHGRIYMLDWKTDILPEYTAADMGRHVERQYQVQIKLYVLAVMKLLQCRTQAEYDRDFGGILYCFMRGMGTTGEGMYLFRPAWSEILGYEQELISSREYI